MAKLLLSRSRSRSEGRLGRKTKDAAKSSESLGTLAQKFENEPLPGPQYIPRKMDALTVESYTVQQRSFDIARPKTSNGYGSPSRVEDRPKTSHGPKKEADREEPNFSVLNRSYTWSREQAAGKARPVPQRQTSSPMLRAFPQRSASRQQDHTPDLEIGVALGSPTHHPKTLLDARSSRMYDLDDYSRSLPQHYVSLDTKMDGFNSGHSSDTIQISENKDSNTKGSWKRFFGKGLFHKKSPQKSTGAQSLTSQTSITTMSSVTLTSIHDTKESMDSLRQDSSIEEQSEPEMFVEEQPEVGSAPLLDVDIPKVEMERYSVMFDSLLNQQGSKLSIYARRKSGVHGATTGQKSSENTTPTPTLNLPKKKDSLTVGQIGLVNKSPLWLFPATPRTPKSPGRPRAMTTPTETVNGSAPETPEVPAFKKGRPESDIVPSLLMMLEERIERTTSKAEKEPQTPFSVISEGSELDSPYTPYGDYGALSDHKAPWVRKFSMLEEPDWEMVTTPLRPRTPSPTEVDQSANECEAYVAKAAKISIARQISISQRQLLLPVISNPERFVSKSKGKSQGSKTEVSLVITPVKNDTLNPILAPTSAVSSENIALAL